MVDNGSPVHGLGKTQGRQAAKPNSNVSLEPAKPKVQKTEADRNSEKSIEERIIEERIIQIAGAKIKPSKSIVWWKKILPFSTPTTPVEPPLKVGKQQKMVTDNAQKATNKLTKYAIHAAEKLQLASDTQRLSLPNTKIDDPWYKTGSIMSILVAIFNGTLETVLTTYNFIHLSLPVLNYISTVFSKFSSIQPVIGLGLNLILFNRNHTKLKHIRKIKRRIQKPTDSTTQKDKTTANKILEVYKKYIQHESYGFVNRTNYLISIINVTSNFVGIGIVGSKLAFSAGLIAVSVASILNPIGLSLVALSLSLLTGIFCYQIYKYFKNNKIYSTYLELYNKTLDTSDTLDNIIIPGKELPENFKEKTVEEKREYIQLLCIRRMIKSNSTFRQRFIKRLIKDELKYKKDSSNILEELINIGVIDSSTTGKTVKNALDNVLNF